MGLSGEPRGSDAVRAPGGARPWPPGGPSQFELPDYYLVLAEQTSPAAAAAPAAPEDLRPDFYLGPLRSVRPNRVAVAAASEPAEQAAMLLSELGSLRTGRWWPSLEEIFRTAAASTPAPLAESPDAGRATLLSWPRQPPQGCGGAIVRERPMMGAAQPARRLGAGGRGVAEAAQTRVRLSS